MLNPNLDTSALAARFREDGRIRIKNVLDASVAERVRSICTTDVPYEVLSHIDNKNVAIPAAEMAKFDQAQLHEFRTKMMEAASKGVGFFYSGYMMARKQDDDASDNLKFLHSVFEFLNSDEMLDFIAAVTARTDLKSADVQVTRYTPGQFLTRHRDDVGGEQRRLAYVLAFSKNWHPDWGGLLQFFADDGTPRDAWAPQFNSMSLFDIRHIHSVTFVAPFAAEQRLSLAGWFRAKAWSNT